MSAADREGFVAEVRAVIEAARMESGERSKEVRPISDPAHATTTPYRHALCL